MIDPITAFSLAVNPSEGAAGLQRGNDAMRAAMIEKDKRDEERAKMESVARYLEMQGMPKEEADLLVQAPSSTQNTMLNRRRDIAPRDEGVEQMGVDGGASISNPTTAPSQRSTPKEGKLLTDSTTKKLADMVTTLDRTVELKNTFKDEYAGYVFDAVGNAVNLAAKRLPGFKKNSNLVQASQWWTNLKDKEDAVRHDRFGANFTKGEKEEWLGITITPGQNPASIRAGLERRESLEKNAIKRQVQAQRISGRNTGQFEEMYMNGGDPSMPSDDKPTPQLLNVPDPSVKRIRYNSKGERVQ